MPIKVRDPERLAQLIKQRNKPKVPRASVMLPAYNVQTMFVYREGVPSPSKVAYARDVPWGEIGASSTAPAPGPGAGDAIACH